MSFDLASRLNPEQYDAAKHVDGPLLILAGAGSGKTRAITHRIANLILNAGVKPSRILAVTFTNKAAAEMRERVDALLDEAGAKIAQVDKPWVSTFHTTCAQILRAWGAEIGVDPRFVIYDDQDQRNVLKRVFDKLDIERDRQAIGEASAYIDSAKNRALTPPEAMEVAVGREEEQHALVYAAYQDELRRAGCLDFGDLLLQTVVLLRTSAAAKQNLQRRFWYLMVDEFQDTNAVQYELLRLLVGVERNLAVVGDDDQSIYGWRGATVRNILDFTRDFSDAKVVKLERNYRSTQTILDAAWAVISVLEDRMEKRLWTKQEGGERVEIFTGRHEREEATWAVRTVERLVHRHGIGQDEIAIFYRTNAQSRLLEEQFRAAGLGYRLVGGVSFYHRAEVKDLMAYLKVALNPADRINLTRVINTPTRGVGAKTVQKLDDLVDGTQTPTLWDAICAVVTQGNFKGKQRAGILAFHAVIESMRTQIRDGIAPSTILQDLLEHLDYHEHLFKSDKATAQDRIQNVQELLRAMFDFEVEHPDGGLARFLERTALVQQTDVEAGDDTLAEAPVTMMTVHCAKGLEYDAVIVVGMEDGLFPLLRRDRSDEAVAEERRLCYVAMTRARKRLFLANCQRRRGWGDSEGRTTEPSRFLLDLPDSLYSLSPETSVSSVDWSGAMTRSPRRKKFAAARPEPEYDEFDQRVEIVSDEWAGWDDDVPQITVEAVPIAPPPRVPVDGDPESLVGATVTHKGKVGQVSRYVMGRGKKALYKVAFPGMDHEPTIMRMALRLM